MSRDRFLVSNLNRSFFCCTLFNMKILLILAVVGLVIAAGYYFNPLDRVGGGESSTASTTPATTSRAPVTLKTSMGDIGIELYGKDAPKAVENFLKLAKKGFYDGLSFHRVIPGFMVQGGDPNCGKNGGQDQGFCGGGGPGYQFDDEIDAASPLYKTGYKPGVVAMANSGPNTNGSQFFIMVGDTPLPPKYVIFGRVLFGQEVANAMSAVRRNSSDRPLLEPITIAKVVVAQ